MLSVTGIYLESTNGISAELWTDKPIKSNNSAECRTYYQQTIKGFMLDKANRNWAIGESPSRCSRGTLVCWLTFHWGQEAPCETHRFPLRLRISDSYQSVSFYLQCGDSVPMWNGGDGVSVMGPGIGFFLSLRISCCEFRHHSAWRWQVSFLPTCGYNCAIRRHLFSSYKPYK